MNEPKLRFPEFKDKWNNHKIEDMFDRVGTPVDLDDTLTYREIGIRSHGKGIFHKDETTASEIGNKRVFWVEPDCFVVNIVFAWERAVAKTTEAENGMIASHRFPMYKPKKDVVDLNYITEYFITKRGQNVLILASPGGAGRNKTLGQKEFAKSVVKLPSLPEQQKIADFLSTIKTVIEKQKETVSAWEERKKGMMQKLFSQEVRFKADDGSDFPEWKKKPFGDIVSEFKVKTKVENEDTLLSCAINGVFLNSELFGHQRGQSNIGYLKIKKGTLILSAQNLHLGNANVNLRFEHGIISPAYKTYDIVGCSAEYMSQWVKWDMTKQFFYNATTVGASECRRNVDWNMLYSQLFAVPCLAEQQKIADCLSSLDDVIEKQKATLAAWEELKKGLLQQMFV